MTWKDRAGHQRLGIVMENRRITADEIANTLDISFGSPYSILQNRLNFSKVSARWVPNELSAHHKAQSFDISLINISPVIVVRETGFF